MTLRHEDRKPVIARIWSEAVFEWHAEVFTPRTAADPPAPQFPVCSIGPLPPDGYVRRGQDLCMTKRSAARSAKRMKENLLAFGNAHHRDLTVIEV